jgi:hypothetical protein
MSRTITPQVQFYDDPCLDMIVKFYKTYHNHLKPALKELFRNHDTQEIFVVRSKRGEWGEWCETWKRDSHFNPYIHKQGWS